MAEAPVLENAFVRLEPLDTGHAAALAALTVGTGLTRWFPQPLDTPAAVDRFIAVARADAERGQALPFAIIARESGATVGATRLGAIAPEHRRAEIGWTFVGQGWRRTRINTAAKLLLLSHAFERMGCMRVELKTDSRNLASRAAILRIGATEEGTLRHHMVCADGHARDTVYFSILLEEWPTLKAGLEARLAG
jgi:RimJ/RimL family protein N-acetyltransferase